jgi:hypothetical protein
MLNIIAPHQNQLTLAIKIKHINNTQTGLTGSTAHGSAHAARKMRPHKKS